MKYAISFAVLCVVVASADEAISSNSKTAHKSLSDAKHQSKRLAFSGQHLASALSSGFKPIIKNYLAHQRHKTNDVYAKLSSPHSSSYVSTSNVKHSSAFLRGPQSTNSASLPVTIHNPFQFSHQINAHSLPSAHYYMPQPAVPLLGYPNSHHFSYSNQLQSLFPSHATFPQKPHYNHQQPFSAQKQYITSKPQIQEGPITSEVHHNSNGAVSYANFYNAPPSTSLINSQQPQPFYPASAFHPTAFAQSFIGTKTYFPHHQQQQPQAHITKISQVPAEFNNFKKDIN